VLVEQGTAAVFIIGDSSGQWLAEEDPATSPVYPCKEYVDRAVRPTWAMEFERLQNSRDALSAANLRGTNEALGLPIDTTGMTLPHEVRKEWMSRLDQFRRSAEWLVPRGFERSPLPPQMPPGMLAFVKHPTGAVDENNSVWERVRPEQTASLPIPLHPTRARHNTLFAEVFTAVKTILEVTFVPVELPNQYLGPHGDELKLQPWYSFFIGPVEFTVGPRKHVFGISAKSPLAMDMTAIHGLSERDKPTYECASDGRTVLIHAWNREKMLEYLIAIGRAARALGRGPGTTRTFANVGCVNWPTHLHDDREGGMVVLAVVDGWRSGDPFLPFSRDPWRRAELIEPNHYGISPEGMERVLACVPLGSSDGCWWRGDPDSDKPSAEDPYCPWECMLEDLTSEGRTIVRGLQELYGRPVRLVTHIDT
jgi:hypothetical protein